MSESPLQMSPEAPIDPGELGPAYRVEKFDDLAIGMKVWVRVVFGSDLGWRSGVVHGFRDHAADRVRGRIAKRQARVRTTRGTRFFYNTSWEDNRDNIRRVEPLQGAAAEQAIARERALLRQAAKPMNFGTPAPPSAVLTIDGLTAGECFNRYGMLQREQRWVTRPDGGIFEIPPLTVKQREIARAMWSAEVKLMSTRADAEDRRREREQVVCDDDRWEV